MLPQTFFTGLLFVSGLGGTLTLLLALAAPVLRRRYAARTLCTAWLLIALRLLIPFHISMDAAPVRLELPLPAAAASAHEQDAAERQPPVPGAAAWGLDSWNDTLLAYGELEYACMDLDGDSTPELLVQCVDDPASTEPCPYYEVNGQAVDPAEFEAQLNCRVTSLLPGRAAWTGL